MITPSITGANTTNLRDKIRRGEIQSPESMRVAVAESLRPVVSQAMGELANFADTNRYRRAWQQAAQQVDLYQGPIAEIKPSKFKDWRESNLEYSVKFWTLIIERNERQAWMRGHLATKWPSHRRAIKIRDEAERRLQRFRESGGTAAFFYGRAKRGKRGFGLSNLSRITTDVYGGRGQIYLTPAGAYYEMRNMEPHARIVERRKRWAFDLAGRARAFGVRRLKAAAARELAAAAQLQTGSQAA